MTELTKPVTRTLTIPSGRRVAVTLRPEGIEFREPRKRVRYLMPYGVVFTAAVRLFVAAEKAAKAKAKKERAMARRAHTRGTR